MKDAYEAVDFLYKDVGIDETDADSYRMSLEVIKRELSFGRANERILFYKEKIEKIQSDPDMDVFEKSNTIWCYETIIKELKWIIGKK